MSGVLVYASTHARRQAERLLDGRIVEVEVERAIRLGRKRPYAPDGLTLPLSADERFCIIDRNVGALLTKGTSRLTGRKAWTVERLIRLQPRTRRQPA